MTYGSVLVTANRHVGLELFNTSKIILQCSNSVTQIIGRPYGFNVPYRRLFDGFEKILARHQGRPHWAKAHPLVPEDLRKLYPDFDKFITVLDQVDPSGVFRSEYIQRHILGKQVDSRTFKTRRT